jgi:hypothetical protein
MIVFQSNLIVTRTDKPLKTVFTIKHYPRVCLGFVFVTPLYLIGSGCQFCFPTGGCSSYSWKSELQGLYCHQGTKARKELTAMFSGAVSKRSEWLQQLPLLAHG